MRLRSPALLLAAAWLVGLAVCGVVACSDFSESEAPATPEGGTPGDEGGGSGGDDAGLPSDSGPRPDAAPGTSAYRAAILADGPIAYWRMGTLGPLKEVPDEMGERPLYLQGDGFQLVTGAVASEGAGNMAVRFDGFKSFGEVTNSTGLDFASGAPFTLECWARHEAVDGGDYFQNLLGKIEDFAPNARGYVLYVSPTETSGQMASPDAAVGVFGALRPPGVWAHYALTFDGTMLTLYIDAIDVQKKTVTKHLGPRTASFIVGRDPRQLNNYWAGDIDEIAIYPKALAKTELIEHHALGRRQ